MSAGPSNWNFVTQSEHAHERRAIEFLAKHLPDHEPYAGWSNFEFTSLDGAYNEVDALVVSKAGCFLVEIKSHPGRLVRADQQSLHLETPDRRNITIPHPIRLANLKAKRLRELLKREAKARSAEIPFIEPLCFLSDLDGFDPGIPAHVLTGLAVRDPERRSPPVALDASLLRPGVMAAILDRSAAGLSAEPRRVDGQPGYVDKPRRKLITQAMESIGFRTRCGHRLIGDWKIAETIDEAEYFRDVNVVHDRRTDKRRARIYFASSAPEASLSASQIESAASREAALLERLRHEGILAYRDHLPSEEGPVLLFESTEGFETLESWCRNAAVDPSRSGQCVATRLDVLRSIAEAVAYAHGQHVVHRGLGPEGILVKNDGGRLAVRVMNWQSGGVAADRATTQFASTVHPGEYHASGASAYAAPELATVGEAIEPTLDIFSLGAIAYRLFAEAPPAASREEMTRLLQDEPRCLELPSDSTEIGAKLQALVGRATHASPEQRHATVGEFLEAIDTIERLLRDDDDQCTSIEEASEGSRLSDGLRVVKRLGKGSTAYGFLVERIGAGEERERFILKIATDSDHNGRIDAEAKAIARLAHDHVIRTEGETFSLFGRRGFLGKPTGDATLRDRLVKEGPIELELLERFGGELLSALSHLESRGVPHRDLKPENIAIVGAESRKALRLVLFDFSLADASPENLRVGTPAYLDPFLEDRTPRRWDTAADRYSAALVLHEMATGTLPVWGQGKVHPRLSTGEIALNGDAFAAGVRDRMLRFFRKALARQPKDRFPDADAMSLEWREIFRDTRHAPTVDAADSLEARLDDLLALQKADTPLSDIPLSTRAANVLDREGVFTVRDLLQRPSNWLLSSRGVGQKTRTELTDLVRALRRRYPDIVVDARASLERAGVKGKGRREPAAAETSTALPEVAPEGLDPRQALEALLAPLSKGERDMACGLFALDAAADAPLAPLPTGSEVGRALGVSRQRVQQVQNGMRKKWAASPIAMSLRQELALRLDRNQGFLALSELARSLAADRGVDPITAADERNARALVGIACDLEAQEPEPRYRLRRRDERQFVVASDEHLRYALELGRKADQLVALDPLPDPRIVREALAAITRPDGIDAIPPDRLPRLAAAGSMQADLSARGELYPIGLPLERAVRLAGATLGRLGTSDRAQPNDRRIARGEILEQLRRRYPKASLAEDGSAIAAVLREQGWNEVRFDATRDELVTRLPDAVSVISPGSRLTVQTRAFDAATSATSPLDPEFHAARDFEQSLRDALVEKRFQVVLVQPEHHGRAVASITRRLGELAIEVVDLDAAITSAIDHALAGRVPNPEIFYEAEAIGPQGRHWPNVLQVANLAIDAVKQSLVSGTTPLLLTHGGLLGRFGRGDLLEAFNRTLTGRESPRGVALLVASDVAAQTAALDGWAIPCLGDQIRSVPKAFLRSTQPALAG